MTKLNHDPNRFISGKLYKFSKKLEFHTGIYVMTSMLKDVICKSDCYFRIDRWDKNLFLFLKKKKYQNISYSKKEEIYYKFVYQEKIIWIEEYDCHVLVEI